jgi:hypothetical protein
MATQTGVTSRSDVRVLPAVGFTEHLTFFDADHDQKISLRETQLGLERLGLGHLLTVPGALFIHLGVAGLGLLRGNAQSPVQLALPGTGFVRHPDTDLVDEFGNFAVSRLDAVFAQYAHTFPGDALTLPELLILTQARVIGQTAQQNKPLWLLPSGLMAAVVEWAALWWMAGELREGKRVLARDSVLRFYTDPQFFHDVAKHIATLREERGERLLGRARNFMQTWVI